MLHVLTFEKAKNGAGREITIDPETAKYTTGITRCGDGCRLREAYLGLLLASHPETVLCDIRPTNDQAKKLAMRSYID